MLKKSLLALAVTAAAMPAIASDSISGGFWVNHTIGNDDLSEATYGDTNYEALVLYIDKTDEKSGWTFSSEMRYGKGAFTDPANNNTDAHFGFHKAWIGKKFGAGQLTIGKSEVPFGWKSVNFWPGDGMMGGYGDQMDVGAKWSAEFGALSYDVAYFHVDDFGNSTESQDDVGHWGSKTTYQKAQTFVGNVAYSVAKDQKVGVSYQNGRLLDLTDGTARPYNGDHNAAVAYYEGGFGDLGVKAQYMTTYRDLRGVGGVPQQEVKNDRKAVTVTYTMGDYNFYVDYSNAESKTKDYKDGVGSADSYASGVSYNYGPGWFYLEYLSNDGDIDENGLVINKDDDAWFVTMDYYF